MPVAAKILKFELIDLNTLELEMITFTLLSVNSKSFPKVIIVTYRGSFMPADCSQVM